MRVFDAGRYSPPSRRDFSEKVVPKLYLDIRQKIIAELKEVQHARLAMFSLTTDLWTSVTREPYMSLTIHFFNRNGLRSLTLATTYVPDKHTGINLAAHLESFLHRWQLTKEDITSITTDSAANMVKMSKELEMRRLPCFGHLLHNAIQFGCKEETIQTTSAKCKKIVAYFHYNNERKLKLGIELSKSNKAQLEMKAECPTRWGSMFNMVQRVCENLVEIKRVLVDDASHLIPSYEEEKTLRSLNASLKPFCSLTDELSGEKEVTSSVVLPMVGIIQQLTECSDVPEADADPMVTEIRQKIVDYLDSR